MLEENNGRVNKIKYFSKDKLLWVAKKMFL